MCLLLSYASPAFVPGSESRSPGKVPARPDPEALVRNLGRMDIYLLDQLLRGRIVSGMRLLDAGMGTGRNLTYFLRSGYDAWGVDTSEESVRVVRALAARHAPALPPDNFRLASIEELPFPNAGFDVVIANAVLHFSPDEDSFHRAARELWRVLRPGGMLFCRLASTIGLQDQMEPLGGRRYHLPDGSTRFLVDAPFLHEATADLGGRLLDPLKTTVVDHQRSMTTWVVRKEDSGGSVASIGSQYSES